ncbi:hypothetical protein N7532_010261 [Penicillium argentinense]|uniref:Uncharacterized protein n=1 Tax=Penicillium argentinense TaxID=1131581 RepID=A0A9W9EPG5_9EURO|nr:uncharacterized protein N7532_010261 [Penicillium argentinense]KAJ5085490.1 hypothetical protein N7532_010261 [Penicillium argentinense]
MAGSQSGDSVSGDPRSLRDGTLPSHQEEAEEEEEEEEEERTVPEEENIETSSPVPRWRLRFQSQVPFFQYSGLPTTKLAEWCIDMRGNPLVSSFTTDADRAVIRKLPEQPRYVDWRVVDGIPQFKNCNRAQQRRAAMAQRFGQLAPLGEECSYCSSGKGSFESCRVAIDDSNTLMFQGSCLCCAFLDGGAKCSFRTMRPLWIRAYENSESLAATGSAPSTVQRRGRTKALAKTAPPRSGTVIRHLEQPTAPVTQGHNGQSRSGVFRGYGASSTPGGHSHGLTRGSRRVRVRSNIQEHPRASVESPSLAIPTSLTRSGWYFDLPPAINPHEDMPAVDYRLYVSPTTQLDRQESDLRVLRQAYHDALSVRQRATWDAYRIGRRIQLLTQKPPTQSSWQGSGLSESEREQN